jgi:hypothetical protein
MVQALERRDFLKLVGVGGVVYASSLLQSCASASGATPASGGAVATTPKSLAPAPREVFFFLQISDTHWGYSGPNNPHADVELKHAVAAINAVGQKPDFIVFTGDLTHSTDDVNERRRRMQEFQQIVSALQVPMLKFMPGEHDAAADQGAVFGEIFGPLHYAFDHKGIHFIALDNVSDPRAQIGNAQLAWLERDLAQLDPAAPIVVFTHRPLWDLKPEWDWTTADGARALNLLQQKSNVSVFFGHIHQELHHQTGRIAHHAARSLMFALPAPETPGKRAPVAWDPAHPEQGLGYRSVRTGAERGAYALHELPLPAAETAT